MHHRHLAADASVATNGTMGSAIIALNSHVMSDLLSEADAMAVRDAKYMVTRHVEELSLLTSSPQHHITGLRQPLSTTMAVRCRLA